MRVGDGIACLVFRFCDIGCEDGSVGSASRVDRRECMEFNGAAVFGRALVGACIITQIGTGEFLFKRILQIVGVPEQLVTVEHGNVGHTENRTRGEFSGRHVDPCQVGVVGNDLPGPNGGVAFVVVGANNIFVSFCCVVLVNGGLGLIDVNRRRNSRPVNGVRQHEDQRERQADERSQEVGVLCQRLLHESYQQTGVLEALYPESDWNQIRPS